MLNENIEHIHFVGIGGAGVSALAHLALKQGRKVTGSDLRVSPLTKKLEMEGARVDYGHHENHVKMADLVVHSTAVGEDNVEIRAALDREIPVVSRIDMLSYMVEEPRSITVSGSHGKSTTSGMIATTLDMAGKEPRFAIGAQICGGVGNAQLGSDELFVCEGDESNDSYHSLETWLAVVTNIDDDHLDYHDSLENLKQSFLKFMRDSDPEGGVVVCGECPIARELINRVEDRRVITYGFREELEYRAVDLSYEGFGTEFTVVHEERGELGDIRIEMPGEHNVLNALATVAVSQVCDVNFSGIAYAIENFPGVKRRFDVLTEGDDLVVVDDYAHHPTEIRALIESTAKVTDRDLRVVFQPHRFTRSKKHAQSFPECFEAADEIILTEIYGADEDPIDGIELEYLLSFFEERFADDKIKHFHDHDEILQYLIDSHRPGEMVMTVGAGDICKTGEKLAEMSDSDERRSELEVAPPVEKAGGLFD